jgi:hypothetical protein
MQPVLIRVQEHGIFTEENCTHDVASKHEIFYSGLYLQHKLYQHMVLSCGITDRSQLSCLKPESQISNTAYIDHKACPIYSVLTCHTTTGSWPLSHCNEAGRKNNESISELPTKTKGHVIQS